MRTMRALMTLIHLMLRDQHMSKQLLYFHIFRAISEEVSYSQSSDTDHENEEEHEDAIQQKEESFNQKPLNL